MFTLWIIGAIILLWCYSKLWNRQNFWNFNFYIYSVSNSSSVSLFFVSVFYLPLFYDENFPIFLILNFESLNREQFSKQISSRFRKPGPVTQFFYCYLAFPQSTLGHSRGDSLTNPMIITAFVQIRPKGHREPRNDFDPKVIGSLIMRLGH